jgi:general secretion pathway protein I
MGIGVRWIVRLLRRAVDAEQRQGADGFTLVEVIAALAILSLSLVVLFSSLSEGFHNQQKAKTLSEATTLAQSLLARVGPELPLRPGENSGALPGHYRWTMQIAPFGTPADQQQWPVAAYRVSVEIFENANSSDPIFTLTTLRLGEKGQGR